MRSNGIKVMLRTHHNKVNADCRSDATCKYAPTSHLANTSMHYGSCQPDRHDLLEVDQVVELSPQGCTVTW